MHSAVVASAVSIFCLLEPAGADSSNGSAPGAIVVSPSEYFEGNDGPWSSFFIRVGTPEQDVRVLVSTASPESMVVLSDLGCSTAAFSSGSVPSNCATSRGVLFNSNDSSTWHEVGNYGINGDGVGLEANLGYSESATFALENLGIGLTGPSLKNQTVAGIAAAEPMYLGLFGLNSQPVNFSSLGNYSAPSFLTTLKDQGVIPSLSWSYTAGAQYRLKQVYGQLIFSGYDTSRFDTDKAVSFTMAGDLTRDLVVDLQSISYSGSDEVTLLSDSIEVFIDSTDPNLWLPDSVCDAFENAFGLTMDNTSGLYLVNDTHHTQLLNTDAEVSFRLSDVSSRGETVTITLPYDSFALTAQPPLVENSSYYFPLKRAANSTQYTLGRVFLQEAYLSADYERGVFNLSACVWNQGAVENIVTIPSKDGSSSTGGEASSSSNSAHLSPGAIAGIVIGCIAFVVVLGLLIALLIRRRNITITYTNREPLPDEAVMSGPIFNFNSTNFGSSVPTGSSPAQTEGEAISNGHSPEMDGREALVKPSAAAPDAPDGSPEQPSELPGETNGHAVVNAPVVHELPGSTVPAGMMNAHEDALSTVGTLPSRDGREEAEEEPPSPFTSTIGTAGWRDFGHEGSDVISPTTPVHHHHGSDSP